MKSSIHVIILLWFLTANLGAQSFIHPNYGLKSHETLLISKVESTTSGTTIYLTVENRRTQGGEFCADKNIYILNPDGSRMKLISSSGIPVCPDSHKFKSVGEKLDFMLVFPPLKPGAEWIDLVEDCSDNCFYFYGITLDNVLNSKINNAFSLAGNDENLKALISFIDIIDEIDSNNYGIEGLLYINIIRLQKETGNATQAAEWYKRFKSSGAPRLSWYIKYLNDQGIKY